MDFQVVVAIPEELSSHVIIDIVNYYVPYSNKFKNNRTFVSLQTPDSIYYADRRLSKRTQWIIRVENYAFYNHFDNTSNYFREAIEEILYQLYDLQPESVAIPVQLLQCCIKDTSIYDTLWAVMDLLFEGDCKFDFILYTIDEDVALVRNRVSLAIHSFMMDEIEKRYYDEKKFITSTDLSRYKQKFRDKNLAVDDFINKYRCDSFDFEIFKFLNSANMSPTELYGKAQISKQDFHRIITDSVGPKNIQNQKYKIISLLLAERREYYTFIDLLATRGFAFSDNIEKDLIIQHCILNEIYDIDKINSILFNKNYSLLGDALC